MKARDLSTTRSIRVLAAVLGLASTFGPSVRASLAEAPPADGAARATMIEIEESLVCQCGCGLTVHSCNHLNCPSGIPMKEEIAKRLARGESKAQITAYFESKYGEKVLSAPTWAGFNLLAWTMPFVALLVGGTLVVVFVRRWVRAAPATGPATETAARAEPEAKDPYRDRLAREISEFDA